MAPPDLLRHALVWLKPGATWITLAGSSSRCLLEWFVADKPAMVARRQGDEPADFLRLGVALPPSQQGKRRLSVAVHSSCIERSRPPLSLSEVMEVIECCPSEWIGPLQLLNSLMRRTKVQPRVYGSFAWQALTSERYVGEDSDIDLLWDPGSAAKIATLVATLTQWERSVQRRADGEVLMSNGDAVCWRELAGESKHVLVKSQSTVALRSRAEVLARFA
jgi:phosphoribosyl-dephospho-CoA transferase